MSIPSIDLPGQKSLYQQDPVKRIITDLRTLVHDAEARKAIGKSQEEIEKSEAELDVLKAKKSELTREQTALTKKFEESTRRQEEAKEAKQRAINDREQAIIRKAEAEKVKLLALQRAEKLQAMLKAKQAKKETK